MLDLGIVSSSRLSAVEYTIELLMVGGGAGGGTGSVLNPVPGSGGSSTYFLNGGGGAGGQAVYIDNIDVVAGRDSISGISVGTGGFGGYSGSPSQLNIVIDSVSTTYGARGGGAPGSGNTGGNSGNSPAGGGGGGHNFAGGGGSGLPASGIYFAYNGSGGAGGTSGGNPNLGGVTIGGGGGGASYTDYDLRTLTTTTNGNNGNNGGINSGGLAGSGWSFSITGSPVTYGAGGNGGNTGSGSGPSGINGRGSGGWGGINTSFGGNGTVILRIPTANYSGTTTGSPTITTDGDFTILTYTSGGSYTA